MQFHLNGFEPGDPEISDPAERVLAPGASRPLPLSRSRYVPASL
jgi:phenol 2-monooxygenase